MSFLQKKTSNWALYHLSRVPTVLTHAQLHSVYFKWCLTKKSTILAPEIESYIPSKGISKFSMFLYLQILVSQDKSHWRKRNLSQVTRNAVIPRFRNVLFACLCHFRVWLSTCCDIWSQEVTILTYLMKVVLQLSKEHIQDIHRLFRKKDKIEESLQNSNETVYS